MILIYITNPTVEEAEKIAAVLIEKRLIACANIHPIKSIYNWEGSIKKEDEVVLIAKTREDNYELVTLEVEKIHPYKIPCVIKIAAEANEKYLNWINGEVE